MFLIFVQATAEVTVDLFNFDMVSNFTILHFFLPFKRRQIQAHETEGFFFFFKFREVSLK
jgi:hypothetical protein